VIEVPNRSYAMQALMIGWIRTFRELRSARNKCKVRFSLDVPTRSWWLALVSCLTQAQESRLCTYIGVV